MLQLWAKSRGLHPEAPLQSLEAAWVRLEDLHQYSLRDPMVFDLFAYVARGGEVFPMSILQPEGTPFVIGTGVDCTDEST